MTRSGPNKALIHYKGSLTDFFSDKSEEGFREIRFKLNPGARDLIESQGVPHVEVYALRVNGSFSSLEYNVQNNDELVVYPRAHAVALDDSDVIRSADERPARFVADVHLRKLARLLRLMGLDTAWSNRMTDSEIIESATGERSAVLSRDLGLLKHGDLNYGYWPRSDLPLEQVAEVIRYFSLQSGTAPFSRCMECNGRLQQTDLESVSDRVPEKVKEWNNEYTICEQCDKIYWKGSHYDKLKEKVNLISAHI